MLTEVGQRTQADLLTGDLYCMLFSICLFSIMTSPFLSAVAASYVAGLVDGATVSCDFSDAPATIYAVFSKMNAPYSVVKTVMVK